MASITSSFVKVEYSDAMIQVKSSVIIARGGEKIKGNKTLIFKG